MFKRFELPPFRSLLDDLRLFGMTFDIARVDVLVIKDDPTFEHLSTVCPSVNAWKEILTSMPSIDTIELRAGWEWVETTLLALWPDGSCPPDPVLCPHLRHLCVCWIDPIDDSVLVDLGSRADRRPNMLETLSVNWGSRETIEKVRCVATNIHIVDGSG